MPVQLTQDDIKAIDFSSLRPMFTALSEPDKDVAIEDARTRLSGLSGQDADALKKEITDTVNQSGRLFFSGETGAKNARTELVRIVNKYIDEHKKDAEQPVQSTKLQLTQEDIDKVKAQNKGLADADATALADLIPQSFADEAALKTAVEGKLTATDAAKKGDVVTALVNQVKSRVGSQLPGGDSTAPGGLPNVLGGGLPDAGASPTTGQQPGQPKNTAAMFSASVDISYSRKWGFDMTASSKVIAKLVAVPAPQAFLDALNDARTGLAKQSNPGSGENP